jgi:hypothetical protein
MQSPGNEARPLKPPSYDEGSGAKASVESASGCKLISGALALIHSTLVDLGIGFCEDGRRPWSVRPGSEGLCTLPSLTTTSDRARLPAELKHINKRRKRNQQGFPQ